MLINCLKVFEVSIDNKKRACYVQVENLKFPLLLFEFGLTSFLKLELLYSSKQVFLNYKFNRIVFSANCNNYMHAKCSNFLCMFYIWSQHSLLPYSFLSISYELHIVLSYNLLLQNHVVMMKIRGLVIVDCSSAMLLFLVLDLHTVTSQSDSILSLHVNNQNGSFK